VWLDRPEGTKHVIPTLRDRIAGGLLGLAAGDALGATVEFLTPAQIRNRHGVHRDIVGGGTFGWEPGQGTDDTDLTWAVLTAYLGETHDELETTILPHHRRSVAGRSAANMLAWYHRGPRDIGHTTARALQALARDGDPTRSGCTSNTSAGNGSLMRCLPTALSGADLAERAIHSSMISAITHAEARCLDACWAYNEIAAALLDNALPATADRAAIDINPDWHPTVADALTVDPEAPVQDLSTSGYVIDSLRCAVWAIQQPDSPEDILVALVNRGDDADTTGAIAGGLLGIRDGINALPARWVNQLEYRDRMLAATERLLATRTESEV
jgi:ADP-ribosyl-[dinitrogen reductase] hydrolase